MEARMLFGNANVPFGYKKNQERKRRMVFAVPCKDEAQGKKQLLEFIEGLEKDNDVKQVVADWLQSKPHLNLITHLYPTNLKQHHKNNACSITPGKTPFIGVFSFIPQKNCSHTRSKN